MLDQCAYKNDSTFMGFMEFNGIGSQVTEGLYSDSAILQKSVMGMENTISAHHKEKMQRVCQEEEILELLTAPHILYEGKTETMTVSWVDFCIWHIMINPFINHIKPCLLCSLLI